MDIVKDKIKQVGGLLEEFGIDLWMLFVRETSVTRDPVMDLVVGHEVVWPSFFLYTQEGDAIAIVGSLDRQDFENSGRFTEVLAYDEGVSSVIKETLDRLGAGRIGINFSKDNPTSDGLTYGMYLLLQDYLKGSPYADRLVAAEEVCSRIRSRKSELEIKKISEAAGIAVAAWDEAIQKIETGMTEIEIADIIFAGIRQRGCEPSFETIVNAGSKTQPGHGTPTGAVLEPGDLLHVDFGARVDKYCSDLQRLAYFRKDGETAPPPELSRAFDLVRRIIERTAEAAVPGTPGVEVDSLAREMLRGEGYDEYQHALGHQLGRAVHDGGGLLGPKWERYGPTVTVPVEVGNVFTLELEIMLPGIGCVGLEEDVCITEKGARFLCPRQQELVVK